MIRVHEKMTFSCSSSTPICSGDHRASETNESHQSVTLACPGSTDWTTGLLRARLRCAAMAPIRGRNGPGDSRSLGPFHSTGLLQGCAVRTDPRGPPQLLTGVDRRRDWRTLVHVGHRHMVPVCQTVLTGSYIARVPDSPREQGRPFLVASASVLAAAGAVSSSQASVECSAQPEPERWAIEISQAILMRFGRERRTLHVDSSVPLSVEPDAIKCDDDPSVCFEDPGQVPGRLLGQPN